MRQVTSVVAMFSFGLVAGAAHPQGAVETPASGPVQHEGGARQEGSVPDRGGAPTRDQSAQGSHSPGTSPISASFFELDANQDGAIGPDEAQGHWELVGRWATLDKDGDGEIDQAEFAAFKKQAPMEAHPGPPEKKRIEGDTEIPAQEHLNIQDDK